MRTLSSLRVPFSLLGALLAAGPLAAQDDPAVTARLIPAGSVARAGSPLELTLRVEVVRDAAIDAAVLRGRHLEVAIAGGEEAEIGGATGEEVEVAGGTTIERRLAVDLPAPRQRASGRLSVTWPGLAGASASVRVVPDPASFAVEDLDLGRTRVLLRTSEGDMTLAFMPDKAPKTVESFVELSRKGFYDETKFHRVIPGFMIQGGCPNTKPGGTGVPGTGGPGYNLPDEFSDVRHVRGVVSMANLGRPGTAGSQFFICHGEASHLDGKYTAFARLQSGQDTLDRIASVELGRGQQSMDTVPSVPVQPVWLHEAIVLPAFREDAEDK